MEKTGNIHYINYKYKLIKQKPFHERIIDNRIIEKDWTTRQFGRPIFFIALFRIVNLEEQITFSVLDYFRTHSDETLRKK